MKDNEINETVELKVGSWTVTLNSKGKISVWQPNMYGPPDGIQMNIEEFDDIIRVIQMFKLTKTGWVKKKNITSIQKNLSGSIPPNALKGIEALKKLLLDNDKHKKRKGDNDEG